MDPSPKTRAVASKEVEGHEGSQTEAWGGYQAGVAGFLVLTSSGHSH
jgi:hypothetical protein